MGRESNLPAFSISWIRGGSFLKRTQGYRKLTMGHALRIIKPDKEIVSNLGKLFGMQITGRSAFGKIDKKEKAPETMRI